MIEFIDFIVDIKSGASTGPLTENYKEFHKIIVDSADKEILLTVYSCLTRKMRIVKLTPSTNWGNHDSYLGALVRYEEYTSASERALKVGKVAPNSPAWLAGFQEDKDYILGTPQYFYQDLNSFASFIELTQEEQAMKAIEIFLYNSDENSVRSTLLTPRKDWGGKGLVGCEFGLGILNHLPYIETDEAITSSQGSTSEGSKQQ